jgi:nucleoside-diphosphate-sugar epimerase
MKVFVTGATGVVGLPVVTALVDAGHHVAAVTRTDEKAQLVASLGAVPIRVDLFDSDAVAHAVSGQDAVVNLATKIPPMREAARRSAWRENDRIRREASRNLVDAALAADVEWYVQESVAFMYEDRGDEWIDEDVPFDPPPLAASTLEAEGQARRFDASGRTGVVLRFGMFYGPTSSHTCDLAASARRGFVVLPGRPDAYMTSVHADDAAAAVPLALAVPSGAYNVVDDEPLTRREYCDALAAAVGVKRVHNLGSWAGRAPSETLRAVGRSQRVSNKRFRDATGWSPRHPTARDGLREVIAAMATAEQEVADA